MKNILFTVLFLMLGFTYQNAAASPRVTHIQWVSDKVDFMGTMRNQSLLIELNLLQKINEVCKDKDTTIVNFNVSIVGEASVKGEGKFDSLNPLRSVIGLVVPRSAFSADIVCHE